MRYNFCTLFDMNYGTRGLALYRSLERNCPDPFRLTILCMDRETRDTFAQLNLPLARLLLVEDLGDSELLAVRETRPRREFCMTCTAPLMLSLLREAPDDEIVSYLDADLAFYSDPRPIFDEMVEKDILIHAHRFAPRHADRVETSGMYNVGLVAVRRTPEGLACLERWRAQCIEVCALAPGYCGDQKYLDEWPTLYKNLAILTHPGAGLAPWNVENYTLSRSGGKVTVDGKPLIFYHYHALLVLFGDLLGRSVVVPSIGYPFNRMERRLLYRPYARLLQQASAEIVRVGSPQVSQSRATSLRELLAYSRRGQLVIS